MRKANKKTIAAAMAILQMFGMGLTMSVSAEEIELKKFSAEAKADTSENLYASAFYGLCERELEVNGETRSISIYTPANYEPCCEMLLVFVPNGKTAEEFANECGWPALAEKYNFGITFYQPKDGVWDIENPQSEIDYYIAAAGVVGEREIIDSSEAALYITGYGEGATVAQSIALNYSSMFAGAMFMGGNDAISASYLEETGNKISYPFAINSDFTLQIEGSYNKDVPMPIWIVNDGDNNEALTDYWKKANQVTDEGLSNEYARIYNEDIATKNQSINNRPYSRVWISDIENAAEYFDADFEEFAWTNFFTKIRRFTSEANGALRAAVTPESIGAVRYDIDVQGDKRFWYAYAPEGYDGSEALPLVLCCPGHSIAARLFIEQTEWWRVAEERNILIAFCQGGRCASHELSGCIAWQSSEEGLDYEMDYFNQVIAGMSKNYNVDKERIYITGHSNGGMMTGLLAKEHPELFAAAANVGGMFGKEETVEPSEYLIPYIGIAGQYDLGNQGDYKEGSGSYFDVQMHLARNDMSDTKEEVGETGGYTLVSYRGSDLQIPLVQYLRMSNFHHSYTPQYARYVWDDVFSNYSRNEDGTLYYRGIPVTME